MKKICKSKPDKSILEAIAELEKLGFTPYLLAVPEINKRMLKGQIPQVKEILSIHLHTFRHWNATMEYHKTKDILHVMKRLGHRRIENTLIYTQLIEFESDEYHSAVAENVDEARKLIEAGFEYVCAHEDNMLFRKRK